MTGQQVELTEDLTHYHPALRPFAARCEPCRLLRDYAGLLR